MFEDKDKFAVIPVYSKGTLRIHNVSVRLSKSCFSVLVDAKHYCPTNECHKRKLIAQMKFFLTFIKRMISLFKN